MKPRLAFRFFAVRWRGFTLLELLCVLAIIAVLAALLFPALAASRRSATIARTRTRFADWSAAIESFRAEYGFYPVLDSGNRINGGIDGADHPFHDVLAGRRRDGTALPATTEAARQNRKRIGFHVFAAAELNAAGLLCDASDQTEVAVLVDRDLDGVIKVGADFSALPSVQGMTPTVDDFPAAGIRAGVVFYAAAPGASPASPRFVCSWK